ncbi:MAG: MFS transporter [Polaromonas sp.]|nr:MFS transporter [Polaromonas sp.]
MAASTSLSTPPRLPLGLLALTAGSFGIGTTEFVIMGLLLQVSADLGVTIASAGLLISGYALGVAVGAPLLTLATRKLPRKTVLLALMAIFTLGNLACALAPDYGSLMAARVITSMAHGTFFGVGSIVATGLVAPERKASAIAIMFSGLSLATLLGVPAGAWLGLHYGWRSTFWVVTLIGLLAFVVLAIFVPRSAAENGTSTIRQELAGLARAQVLLGLLMTVLGFAGLFAIFTYIQPILTQITGFSDAAVSPILLVFGGGFFVGNLLGGRLADRGLRMSLLLTLGALALVLGVMGFVLHSPIATVVFVGLLGAASFATVAPLQMRVLQQAHGAGQNLAASLNIGAFNVGNALGAWLGGLVVSSSYGLGGLSWLAALITVAGIVVALYSLSRDKTEPRAIPATS